MNNIFVLYKADQVFYNIVESLQLMDLHVDNSKPIFFGYRIISSHFVPYIREFAFDLASFSLLQGQRRWALFYNCFLLKWGIDFQAQEGWKTSQRLGNGRGRKQLMMVPCFSDLLVSYPDV